jgi:hypothetical protein
MRTGTLIAAAMAGTVAVLGVGAAPGFAAKKVAKSRPIAAVRPAAMSMLALTVAQGEAATPVQRRALLTCNPAAGTVQQPRAACAAINAAKGDLSKLPAGDGMCMMLWDPVTVSASGHWKGKPVKYVHTYSNACVLKQETGAVFAF